MKKLLLLTVATLFMSSLIFAQTLEEWKESKERVEEMLKLSSPKKSGITSIDEVAVSIDKIASRAMKITPVLRGLYFCSIGQTIDGVADGAVTAPTMDECLKLSRNIEENAKELGEVTKDVAKIKDEVKGIKNPMKLKKATTSIKDINKSSAIVVEESTFQVKIIAEIIKTLTSAGNL